MKGRRWIWMLVAALVLMPRAATAQCGMGGGAGGHDHGRAAAAPKEKPGETKTRQAIERLLAEDGYRLAVLFDHRLTPRTALPLRLSRLRVGADANLPRFRSILSGFHPAGLAVSSRLRRPVRGQPKLRGARS